MEGRQFNRRTLAILVVLTALLLLFFGVLYNLQVLHVDDYRAQSVVKIANRKTVEAARGELLDRYGRSMVTNRATYQLTLNTGVMGEEAVRNANLLELLNICRDNGLTWTDTLAVSTAAPFTYTSDTPLAYEKEGGGVALTRLGRLLNALPMKKELKSSLNLPATEQVEAAKTLDDIPAGPTAEELIAALRTYFEIDPSWSDADARALIGVLYETNLRTYSINQQAYIFAQDVNIDVISAVKERRLTGVTIETTTVRQYNTVAAAHLLGHVGDIQSSNWDYYREQGYSMNDKVGIDGAENAFEEYLRGESGVQIQELSTSGKVVSEYWRIDPETGEEQIPKPGDNVLLTLDLRLQEKVEEILANTIETLESEDTGGGAVVVESVKTGEILTMASYPTYDLSRIYSDTALYNRRPATPAEALYQPSHPGVLLSRFHLQAAGGHRRAGGGTDHAHGENSGHRPPPAPRGGALPLRRFPSPVLDLPPVRRQPRVGGSGRRPAGLLQHLLLHHGPPAGH